MVFLSTATRALANENLTLYARCYAHLTGKPLPLKHPLRPSLEGNAITGESACLNLLDKAELDENGKTQGDAESLAVLQQFFEFHRTWFNGPSFEKMQGYVAKRALATHDMYEPSEGALALTHVLFSKDPVASRYEQTLKSSKGYFALRELDPSIKSYKTETHQLPTRRFYSGSMDYSTPELLVKKDTQFITGNYETSQVITFQPLQTGQLVGIQPDTRQTLIPNYDPMIAWLASSNVYRAPVPMENALATPGLQAGFNLFASHGGGILGFNSLMLINWGHESGRLNDGSLKMPRRWAQESLRAMLCKELPALRANDVGQFVDTSNKPDVADFRKSVGCVQCHATMDQMASVTRNLFVADTDYWFRGINPATGKISKMGQLIGRAAPTMTPISTWSSTPIKDFHRQTPTGRIFFRTFKGTLIDVPVTGVDGAGAALATTDDFYLCAAKRYFEHFTGIEVQLFDPGDPQNANLQKSLTDEAHEHRAFIEKLATDLKAQQSSRALVKSILRSKYFKTGGS